MSHEIESVVVDGQSIVEAMYANRPAWHGLGKVFDKDGNEAPNSEQAIELAHLGWVVDKRKLVDMDGHDSGMFGNFRADNNNCLGIVSGKYIVVQNSEAFSFLDSLCQDGIMTYESAFALNGGKQVVLLARLPEVDEYTPGDHGLRYIMLKTSHDGTCEIQMVPTAVRVVCANTVRAALHSKQKISVSHRGDIAARLLQAKFYLSQFSDSFTLYSKAAADLITQKYSSADLNELLNKLFPIPEKDGKAKTIRENNVFAVMNALTHPTNNLEGMGGTKWQLFNAVTYAVDHGNLFRQNGKDVAKKAESNFTNVIEGKGANLKDKALELILSL